MGDDMREITARMTHIIESQSKQLKKAEGKSDKILEAFNEVLHSIAEDRPDLILKHLEYMKIEKR